MDRTIIGGTIEFLDKGLAVVHEVNEVYKVGSDEERDALEDVCYHQGIDWIVIEDYIGDILVTRECLLKLVGCIRGE